VIGKREIIAHRNEAHRNATHHGDSECAILTGQLGNNIRWSFAGG
jgi:hypothetical protein